jgi:hypothetical protein
MEENLVWVRVSRLGRTLILLQDGQPVGIVKPEDVDRVIGWNNLGAAKDEPADQAVAFYRELGLDPASHWEALAVMRRTELLGEERRGPLLLARKV